MEHNWSTKWINPELTIIYEKTEREDKKYDRSI